MAQLICNEQYLDFQKITVLTQDETKPWKPALTVEVELLDGKKEVINAATPFFTFVTKSGNLTVSAAACGHIHDLHIVEEDLGSRFSVVNLGHLFTLAAKRLPDDIAGMPGVSAFALEMGRHMGHEALATTIELVDDKIITMDDVAVAESWRYDVYELNKQGSLDDKQKFIADFSLLYPDCKIRFELVRDDVVVPVVIAPKRPTTQLFMVFGPANGQKTLYTAAPGRYMPRHPKPSEFRPDEGGVDGRGFHNSLNAWFYTAMLKQA